MTHSDSSHKTSVDLNQTRHEPVQHRSRGLNTARPTSTRTSSHHSRSNSSQGTTTARDTVDIASRDVHESPNHESYSRPNGGSIPHESLAATQTDGEFRYNPTRNADPITYCHEFADENRDPNGLQFAFEPHTNARQYELPAGNNIHQPRSEFITQNTRAWHPNIPMGTDIHLQPHLSRPQVPITGLSTARRSKPFKFGHGTTHRGRTAKCTVLTSLPTSSSSRKFQKAAFKPDRMGTAQTWSQATALPTQADGLLRTPPSTLDGDNTNNEEHQDSPIPSSSTAPNTTEETPSNNDTANIEASAHTVHTGYGRRLFNFLSRRPVPPQRPIDYVFSSPTPQSRCSTKCICTTDAFAGAGCVLRCDRCGCGPRVALRTIIDRTGAPTGYLIRFGIDSNAQNTIIEEQTSNTRFQPPTTVSSNIRMPPGRIQPNTNILPPYYETLIPNDGRVRTNQSSRHQASQDCPISTGPRESFPVRTSDDITNNQYTSMDRNHGKSPIPSRDNTDNSTSIRSRSEHMFMGRFEGTRANRDNVYTSTPTHKVSNNTRHRSSSRSSERRMEGIHLPRADCPIPAPRQNTPSSSRSTIKPANIKRESKHTSDTSTDGGHQKSPRKHRRTNTTQGPFKPPRNRPPYFDTNTNVFRQRKNSPTGKSRRGAEQTKSNGDRAREGSRQNVSPDRVQHQQADTNRQSCGKHDHHTATNTVKLEPPDTQSTDLSEYPDSAPHNTPKRNVQTNPIQEEEIILRIETTRHNTAKRQNTKVQQVSTNHQTGSRANTSPGHQNRSHRTEQDVEILDEITNNSPITKSSPTYTRRPTVNEQITQMEDQLAENKRISYEDRYANKISDAEYVEYMTQENFQTPTEK